MEWVKRNIRKFIKALRSDSVNKVKEGFEPSSKIKLRIYSGNLPSFKAVYRQFDKFEMETLWKESHSPLP